MEENNNTLNVKKIAKWKIALIIVGAILGTIVLVVGGYVGYVLLSYNRIGNVELSVEGAASKEVVNVDEELVATTYNIGFGAYSQDYTFFLDTGYDAEGNPTCGYYSKARSYDDVVFNTNGAINTIKELSPDFALFQEVDTNSTRSYHVNQDEVIMDNFTSYSHTHAKNFHTAFLPYPLYDMHGVVNAGLTTMSRYQINHAERKEYTIADDLSKLFDLDRCFSVNKIKVNNDKNLYIVNSHMSAYDEGGKIRETQMQELNAFLNECKNEGAYVVIGGDFNHDLLTYNPSFNYNTSDHRAHNMNKKTPDWISYFFLEDGKSPLVDGYKVAINDNHPTCRNNDIEWDPKETFVATVDGFIVSDNIEINNVEVIQTKNGKKHIDGFAYSDHEPVKLSFKLLA